MADVYRLDKRHLPRMANAFCIWRAGQSMDWVTSISELADITKLSVATVSSICAEKGWVPLLDFEDETPLDVLMLDPADRPVDCVKYRRNGKLICRERTHAGWGVRA